MGRPQYLDQNNQWIPSIQLLALTVKMVSGFLFYVRQGYQRLKNTLK